MNHHLTASSKSISLNDTGFDRGKMIGRVLCVAIASTTSFVNAFCRHRNSSKGTDDNDEILTRIVLRPRRAVGFT